MELCPKCQSVGREPARPAEVRGLCKNHYVVAIRNGELEKVRAYRRPPPRDGEVWCTSCKQYRPQELFRWNAPRKNWDRSCRPCKGVAYERHLNNPAPETEEQAKARRAKNAAYMRAWNLKNRDLQRLKVTLRNWGLTEAQYASLFDAQGHRCAVCGSPPRAARTLSIDHCHTTGRIRGLLCQDCNMGIGQFADDPERLEAAADYLRNGGVVHDESLVIPPASAERRRAAKRDAERAART